MNLNGTINGIKSKFNLNPSRDKSREEYVLNPSEHPENEVDPHEEEIRIREEELRKKSELLEIELAQLEHNKTAKIKKQKAKRLNLIEWIQTAKLKFSEKMSKHKGIFMISALLFAASVFLHGKSFEIFLSIFLPSLHPIVLFVLGILFALSLEGLATNLYESYEDNLAHSIYAVSLLVIVSMGVYEYIQGKSIIVSIFRTIIGSLSLIGLYAGHRAMRSTEFWQSRKEFKNLPRAYRKEINSLLERLLEDHKNGIETRLDFKDFLKTYNLKSASFEKVIIRKGLRSNKFFKQLPARRRVKKI